MTRNRVSEQSGTAARGFVAAAAMFAGIAVFAESAGLVAQQAPATAANCSITGTITGLGTSLPGVSITVRRGDTVQTATSTDMDGRFRLTLPDASYQITAELTGFEKVTKDVTVDRAAACSQTVDLAMGLVPRTASTAAPATGRGAGPTAAQAANGGRQGGQAAGQGRFESLDVQQNAATAGLAALIESASQSESDLIPTGFGSEALADAIAVNGDGARVDRGQLNDRQNAFNRGDFQIGNFDNRNENGGFGGFQGGNLQGGNFQGGNFQGGNFQGGNFQQGGRGRGGNNNNQQLGGRGVRQNAFRGNASWNFSGSALDAPRKQLRSDVPIAESPYSRNNFSLSLQGPIKVPGIYENPNNRSRFTFTYQGSRGGTLFDQYATVPDDAFRTGDFSALPVPVIDPQTGLPFPDNKIPADRISAQALALAQYYPAANLPGTTRNYHYSTSNSNTSNSFNLQVQHNFSGQQNQGRGGGGNNQQRTSNAGQAGQGRRLLGTRTNVNMNARIQYSKDEGEQLNVFTTLGGYNRGTSLGLPVSFQIQRGRVQHQVQVNYNRTRSQTLNQFSNTTDIARLMGIQGTTDNPFSWGLPRISFSSISGLSDTVPSQNKSDRFNTSYSYRRTVLRNHQIQIGGDFRYDVSMRETESNANGNFVFTGLYTSGNGSGAAGRLGLDFADFLLGMPQQATIAYGPGRTTLIGRTMGIYFQDDWRMLPSMTVQLGVRYDLLWPFVEENNRMVNLDVNEDFTAAAPVESEGTGQFNGSYPKSLVDTDTNNISPKLAMAWRAPSRFVVRSSYEVNYNNATYSGIANQLSRQPPFATTGTNIGSLQKELLMESALAGIPPNEVRNNYGIDKDYVLGLVQQGVVAVQRDFWRTWQGSVQYTHTRGYNLDIVRAPNRNPDGTLRIDGVQPFTWTSSEGSSVLNSMAFQVTKRAQNGLSWQVDYTLAKSRDNAPSGTGSGGVSSNNIAQDDSNIDAEWARSNFDQRHNFQVRATMELPFGPDRKWLYNGGFAAALLSGWRFTPSFTARSGRPLSVIVRGASRDIATGVNGALRANYDGSDLSVPNPSIDQWFNTAAFSIPASGTFGNSSRNIITGPGSKNLNVGFQREVRLQANRTLGINLNVNNILNMANYSGVDTNVNSPTFGQITGVSGNRTATLQVQFSY